jgi:hypothetical protein
MKFDEYYNINDTYKIKKDWAEIKKLVDEITQDIDKFLGPNKPKSRAVDARRKIRNLKSELLPNIARKILKTKQDYESDYS